MSHTPLVSILIPCYNCAPWLAETLESAIAQTHSHMEIIVVDDGSKDNSLAIAKKYESATVKVISQQNRGQCAAENRALREAQGDFIQYLDADDLLAPDKVERQIACVKTLGDPDCIVSCEWARFYQSSKDAVFKHQLLWQDFSPPDWLICAWENHLMMHGAAWLIPRKVAEKAGCWNEQLSLINDFDYFSRVLLASSGIKFCSGARTYYRSGNAGSLSGSVSEKARESQFLSLNLGTTALLNTEESDRTRQACATVFQRFIYESYPQVPKLRQKAEERVRQLGGSNLQPAGGPVFHRMNKLFGWQRAKQIQNWSYSLGYSKVAVGWKIHKLKERMAYDLRSGRA